MFLFPPGSARGNCTVVERCTTFTSPIVVYFYIYYHILYSFLLICSLLLEYKRNWIQHVNRMPRNITRHSIYMLYPVSLVLPRVMKHYFPTGRRNYGWPLKRLLDTWDRNGSTSGPAPWQIRWWCWLWWFASLL